MTLTTIFVIRHAFRSSWSTNWATGEVSSNIKSPTNIASDPPLTAYGVLQSNHLAEEASVLKPHVTRIYSSPFYRCIQTIEPLWRRLNDTQLICDRGIGEWFGRAEFKHFQAADLRLLQSLFPGVDEKTSIIPAEYGESIDELHDRIAYALSKIIADVDEASPKDYDESIIICSHAAPIIAIGRALTGVMPSDPNHIDFDTYTASISRFQRISLASNPTETGHVSANGRAAWRNGKGVGGGWKCQINAAVGHLPNGGERNWHFSGDESVVHDLESGGMGSDLQPSQRGKL